MKEEQRGVGVKGAVSMRRRINVRRRRSLRANLSEWLEKEDMFLVRQSLVRARTVQSRVDEQRELASTEQWLRARAHQCLPALVRVLCSSMGKLYVLTICLSSVYIVFVTFHFHGQCKVPFVHPRPLNLVTKAVVAPLCGSCCLIVRSEKDKECMCTVGILFRQRGIE